MFLLRRLPSALDIVANRLGSLPRAPTSTQRSVPRPPVHWRRTGFKDPSEGASVNSGHNDLRPPEEHHPAPDVAISAPQRALRHVFRVRRGSKQLPPGRQVASIVVVLGLNIPPEEHQPTVVTQARSSINTHPASSTPPQAHHPAPDVAISTALLRELLPHPPMPSLKVLPAERQERPSQLDRVL